MLLQAQADLNIDLQNSWIIGDKESDIAAGKAVECNTIIVCDKIVETQADFICTNLNNAINLIMGHKK